jgi:SAM-dependent methyltransferase
MKKILSLGKHYVSDFLEPFEEAREAQKHSLDLYLDESIGAVRLEGTAPLDKMYGQYWYRSALNLSMVKQLHSIVNEICERVRLEPGDAWLDIACNDGVMFPAIPDFVAKFGIDPADDSFLKESSEYATVVQDFFSKEAYFSMTDKRARVVTCIAMLYDLAEPEVFVRDLYEVLDDDGVFVAQLSYTPLMLKQMAFDNICHEHIYYYDLTSLRNLFEDNGFILRDCTLNDTNGGSFRVYFQKDISNEKTFATRQVRDVCQYRIDSILNYEQDEWNIRDEENWKKFSDNIWKLKDQVTNFLRIAKKQGKTVYGYGASTKGNTLLQLFDITPDLLHAIAERSKYKFGVETVGTRIPIVSEKEMREVNPDYLLVLPWHFIDNFVEREQNYLINGGSLVVPCPKFEIITWTS